MVKIQFSTDNDAFVQCPRSEIIRILQALGRKAWAVRINPSNDATIPIRDINGNMIGECLICLSDTPRKEG